MSVELEVDETSEEKYESNVFLAFDTNAALKLSRKAKLKALSLVLFP